jgi:type I restriction enzyme S subunit
MFIEGHGFSPFLPISRHVPCLRVFSSFTESASRSNHKPVNDNLEAQAQSYFDSLFFGSDEPDCTLAEIALVNPTRSLQKGKVARCFEMASLPTKGCIPLSGELKSYNGGVRFINGDTIIARITPCLENGKAAYINILDENEVAFGSTEYIVFAAKEGFPSSFYYFLIRNSRFVQFALQFMNGSSGRQRVSGDELASFPLKYPSAENLASFDRVGHPVLDQMKNIAKEIQALVQLQEMQSAALSSR